jgi:hypothetical protein
MQDKAITQLKGTWWNKLFEAYRDYMMETNKKVYTRRYPGAAPEALTFFEKVAEIVPGKDPALPMLALLAVLNSDGSLGLYTALEKKLKDMEKASKGNEKAPANQSPSKQKRKTSPEVIQSSQSQESDRQLRPRKKARFEKDSRTLPKRMYRQRRINYLAYPRGELMLAEFGLWFCTGSSLIALI